MFAVRSLRAACLARLVAAAGRRQSARHLACSGWGDRACGLALPLLRPKPARRRILPARGIAVSNKSAFEWEPALRPPVRQYPEAAPASPGDGWRLDEVVHPHAKHAAHGRMIQKPDCCADTSRAGRRCPRRRARCRSHKPWWRRRLRGLIPPQKCPAACACTGRLIRQRDADAVDLLRQQLAEEGSAVARSACRSGARMSAGWIARKTRT